MQVTLLNYEFNFVLNILEVCCLDYSSSQTCKYLFKYMYFSEHIMHSTNMADKLDISLLLSLLENYIL